MSFDAPFSAAGKACYYPAYLDIREQLKGYLIQTMLFSGTGKNHRDDMAARVVDKPTTDARAKRLKAYIATRW